MKVKTAELKNNLSKYLRRVRAGRTITVLERDTPIATLAPIVSDEQAAWQRHRREREAKAAKLGLRLTMPEKRPPTPLFDDIEPVVAADGRTDLSTIDLVRGGRDY